MSRKLILLVALGAVIMFLVGYGGANAVMARLADRQQPAAAGDAAHGREIFKTTCALCHGSSGRGMPGLGKDLVNQSAWMQKQDDAALIAFIKVGRAGEDPLNETGIPMLPMGGNPTLTDADLADVVAYIRSIQKK
ncbi:MAG: cytochrome c family protein [Symbiobacteriaceae bacterium]|jgi:mono/diheme cytochrome c family protein|nr:cytochrome c family protein [Symbiobacteriaceae bacterium]